MAYREKATISYINSGRNDHRIITCWIGCDLDGGAHQAMGGLILNEKLLEDFNNDLCKTFNVNNVNQLKGKECYVLRSFDYYQESIAGLEAIPSGLRFTIRGFQKKHFPDKYKATILQERKQRLKNEITRLKNSIEETKKELRFLASKYKDWEK